MGDTGSMALGITLGVLAMYTNTAFLLPFFAFIPLVETLSVVVQLISKKFRKRKFFFLRPFIIILKPRVGRKAKLRCEPGFLP